MRLSIDITPEQHQCLKVAAALQGKSLKDYVLERALSDVGGADGDMRALETLLKARLQAAAKGEISGKSVNDIADEVLKTESRW